MSIMLKGIESFSGKVVFADCPCEQVMSDIWDYVPYGIILQDDGTYARFYADYGTNAKVDATPEQIATYNAKVEADRLAAYRAKRTREIEDEAMTVKFGRTVKVVRGRKFPIGTTGKVFWMGETKWGWSVGIALDEEKTEKNLYKNVAFVALCNLEVVVNEQELKENLANIR